MRKYYLLNDRVADVVGAQEVAAIANGGGRLSQSRDCNDTQASTQSSAVKSAFTPQRSEISSPSSASTRPPYMRETKLPSTKSELGVHHAATIAAAARLLPAAAPLKHEQQRVYFSDLNLGYIASWKRADQKNLESFRALPEIVGDNQVSR